PAVVLQWDGSSSCWSCHGNGTDSAVPAYADRTLIDGTAKGNKHAKHVTANGYGCSTCHSQTTTDGSTIADRANHVNFAYTVDDDPANANTLDDILSYTQATATCG
ncbi:MAG: hypothetical protein GTO22_21285, partial [Gemmatimonadales bacterium]|nr:hypothetical protein [Gemmatimonadales bacterium]